jgi:class 3 adenylate cyclase
MNEAESSQAWLHRDGEERAPIRGNCSLGRAVANEIVLPDDRVSRRHATVHAQGEREFWLVDLGSRNGTYLNGRRISQPTRLAEGDRVQIGPFSLTFHLSAEASLAAETAAISQTRVELRSEPAWLMLCDIVGSTHLAQDRPAEEMAMLIGGWFARCKEVIEDTGGVINKYLGDGLLAYWPASEPARAHVALALRDLRRLQGEKRPPFRVAIHHGTIVMGSMVVLMGEENLAGPEVNFVFRMEKLAGQLQLERVASAAAVRALGDELPATSAGDHPLAGFPGRHAIYSF